METRSVKIGTQANRRNLLQLYYLRWVATIGQAVTILVVNYLLQITLPLMHMAAVLLFQLVLNLFSYIRHNSNKAISEVEIFLELILDVISLTLMFYFSGGATNPFINLYLMQVVIAATILRSIYTWILVALTLSCYIFLSFIYIGIPHLQHYHIGEFFNLYIHGMLLSYAISAMIVAYFIVKMAKNLRRQDKALSMIKQKQLAEENIIRMGVMAANAAHELGTPLGTIALLAGEIKSDARNEDEAERADVIYKEILRCKDIISRITSSAGAPRAESGSLIDASLFFTDMLSRWSSKHGSVMLETDIPKTAPKIIADLALEQAITNILDNAAQASTSVTFKASWNNNDIQVMIRDGGNGNAEEITKKLSIPDTTKDYGLGMGLILTKTVISRLEGNIRFENIKPQGINAVITIPLKNISL